MCYNFYRVILTAFQFLRTFVVYNVPYYGIYNKFRTDLFEYKHKYFSIINCNINIIII